MAYRLLRTYEEQAKFSIILAAVGGLCVAAEMFCVLQRFDWANFWLVYNPEGKRFLAILGSTFAALAAGATGFFIALNSAGQRRNKRSDLSWTGFFLCAVVITLALSTAAFFWFTKYPIQPPE